MKIKLTLPKPRNPVALAARQRNAGVHEKDEKTRRRDARQALAKAIKQGREDFSPFFMAGGNLIQHNSLACYSNLLNANA